MARTLAERLRPIGLHALRIAHELQLLRLRLESLWSARRRDKRPFRIATTACWKFPIYSQTFVQQEVAALARSGFELRFLYAELGGREELSHPCTVLWGLKRRVFLHAITGAADLEHYRRRMPDRVESLILRISAAAGLSRDELTRHEHFLHAFSFTRAVEAWRADYLHSYFFYEQSLFALIASEMLGIPRGVSCYADHLLQDYALKVVPLHLGTCDILVATSGRIRRELEHLHGAALPTVLVKPNAVDTRSFTPQDHRTHAARDDFHLLCVSRIDPKKGLEYLIDATAILRDKGYGVVTTIVGMPTPDSPESVYDASLRAQAAELGLEKHVHFAGKCNSQVVRAYLRDADVFVAPFVELQNGDKDGIPTAVLEAMASACPIVATDAGSIVEIVDHEKEALIVPQRDSRALAGAVERLLQAPELARRLGEAALVRARTQFDVVECEKPFHAQVRTAVLKRRAMPMTGGKP